ncbi:hypothetical protein FOPE_06560 [Fonsecaea pedrosoi]|nr:hypothetical protein FOPE_06560 [Fonsecaea pedrosoi]
MARWNGPDFNTNELAFEVMSGMLLPAGLGCVRQLMIGLSMHVSHEPVIQSGFARGQHAIDVTLKKAPSSIYLWWIGFQHAASDFAGMQRFVVRGGGLVSYAPSPPSSTLEKKRKKTQKKETKPWAGFESSGLLSICVALSCQSYEEAGRQVKDGHAIR